MDKNVTADNQRRMLRAIRDHRSRLRGFVHRFTGNRHDIDDICQETITRALEAVQTKTVQEPGRFLYGVARNIVRREFDVHSRALINFVSDFSPDEHAADTLSVEETLDDQQQLILFGEAVAKLPAQCQKVFVMKKVYGYSHKEIAGELNISVSTVEKHVATGLKRCSEEVMRRMGTYTEATNVVRFGEEGLNKK